MGTEFSLYKRKPKQRYEIGKTRIGPPQGLDAEVSLMDKTAAIFRDRGICAPSLEQFRECFRALRGNVNMTDLVSPSWAAMWSIMDTPNYSVFKLSRWTRDELADKLYRASPSIDTPEIALKVADHMLAWAGNDDVTLIAEDEEDLANLGWPTRGYRDAGSIWDAM